MQTRCPLRLALGGLLAGASLAVVSAAWAGPPFLTDDPWPTDQGRWEVIPFATGGFGADPVEGAVGLDISYGAAADIQATATLPLGYEQAPGSDLAAGTGNIEIAAKIRLLHQETAGIELSIFPRLFLPGGGRFADHHAAFLLPVFVGRSGEDWSVFGGGGCALNQGGSSRNYCQVGAVATHQMLPNFQLGLEGFYQTPDTIGGQSLAVVGFGGTWDLSDHFHLLGYAGASVANRQSNGGGLWYLSALFTF